LITSKINKHKQQLTRHFIKDTKQQVKLKDGQEKKQLKP